ncbi:MAG: chorismate mutase [Dehalococcoidia bacterium]|nr:chorismate mutase [Dehalococcoidia bacterium]|tara:strand:- start:2524 stop:2919 length:396 start_codon:yes stop_codon:yes gene_type:complete
MAVRGIRGAITVEKNEREAILDGTRELLEALVDANSIAVADIASCHFTTSPDLNADFPAEATRRLEGWKYVPLLCGHEMNVPGSMQKCVRILLHVNTETPPQDIQHIYLRDAKRLRADLAPADDATSPTGE